MPKPQEWCKHGIIMPGSCLICKKEKGKPPGACEHGKQRKLCAICKKRPTWTPSSPQQYWVDEMASLSDPSMLFGKPVPEGWTVAVEREVVIKPCGDEISFDLWRDHEELYTINEPGCQICGKPVDIIQALRPTLSQMQQEVSQLRPMEMPVWEDYKPGQLHSAPTVKPPFPGNFHFDMPQFTIPNLDMEEAQVLNGEMPDPRTISYDCEFSLGMDGDYTQIWTWKGSRTEGEQLPGQYVPEKQDIVSADYEAHPSASWSRLCTMVWKLKPGLTPMGFCSSLASQSVPSQEDETLIQYVKHSRDGKFAPPCGGCGAADLYWAHEIPEGVIVTGEEPDFCKRCNTFGQQVMVDHKTTPTGKYTPHTCVARPGASGDAEGDGGEVETKPADSDETPPEGRPDLEGPEQEDDPWLNGDGSEKLPCPNCNSPHSVDHNGCCDNCGEYMEDMDMNPPEGTEPPKGSDEGEGEGEPSPQGKDMPEPPWKNEGADPSQQQRDGEGESQDEDDDPHVLKTVWFDARCSDGDWLKEYAERAYKRADLATMTAVTADSKAEDALRRTGTLGRSLEGHKGDTASALASLRADCKRWIDELGEFGGHVGQSGTITLVQPGKPDKPLPELHHRDLPTLVKMAHAKLHVLMVGGASVGKGKLARQVADALELPFYALPASLNPQTTVSQIVGYMQAEGNYVGTLFRRAFEHGGIMFLDEIDNAHPAALAAINDAIAIQAGETIAFPDGMVVKHPDFVVMAAANTYGRGPNQTYAARQRGDAATWDRFCVLTLEIDTALEMTLASRTGAPAKTVAEVVRFVRGLRKSAEENNLPVVLGMRTVIDMCKMLNADVDPEIAVDSRCRRGLSDQDWRKLTGDVRDMELVNA